MARDGENLRLPLQDNPAGQGMLLVGLGLLGLGMVMVYSACMNVSGTRAWFMRVEVRHLLYALLALATMGTLWRLDYHALARGRRGPAAATVLLGVALVLAVLVLIPGIGATLNGARRWIRLGPREYAISFQPSEIVKITLMVFLACWLGRREHRIRSFRDTFLPAVGIITVCTGLTILEDFGTACVIAISATCLLLLAGVPWHYLLTLAPPAAGVFYLFVMRSDYRWRRILAFLNPWDESSRWTYQVRQSLIAIGSGGLWGKGLGNGTLKLGFVPEDNSDFIFAVICEELGFAGAAVLMGLLAMLLYLSWRACNRAGDRIGRLLAGGLGLLLVFQALMHVAVNIGSAPPTGMNLPLVSAGGTGLVLVAAAIALMISVTAHAAPELCVAQTTPPRRPAFEVLPPPAKRRPDHAPATQDAGETIEPADL